jgi:Orsellinic acid/F9775 biosynthesis cluster protein D
LKSDVSYIETNPVLTVMGLYYHRHFNVLICKECKKAEVPQHSLAHVGRHGIRLTADQKRDYDAFVKAHNISQVHSVPSPPPHGPPVEMLELIPDGFCCNHCHYCAPARKSINNHWYKKHQEDLKLADKDRFHRGTLQTFFSPIGESFFQVNPELAFASSDDCYMHYLRYEVPFFPPFPAAPPLDEHEVSPMLQLTQWHAHLKGHIEDYKMRCQLMSLVILLSRRAKKGIGCLGDVVDSYLRDIRRKAQKSSISVRCLLMECPQ